MGAVGQKIPHESAKGHVTGEALYLDDMPFAKNELIVDFVGSPVAHGLIQSIDLEAAKAVPGVKAVLTYRDIPGHNLFGPILVDEFFLVEERCEYVGQPIVVIAAQTRKALKRAKALVQLDITPLEPVFTIEQAIQRQQFLGVKREIKRGNVQEAFGEASNFLEDTFFSNGQDQFYLESQAAMAIPGEGNEITVHSSTQNPTEVQSAVAEVLGVGLHDVTAMCKRMGGAFGGKETQAAIPAMMASMVAFYTRCPARVVYSKDDDMKVTGKRHPYRTNYKVSFTDEGLITGVMLHFYSNGGAAADLSTSVMERSMLHADNAYYLPNVEINGTVCKTNWPPNTAFRGFGGPQGVAAIENIMEEIAIHLKKDAYEIRKLNCYGEGERNVTPYGALVKNSILPGIFEVLAETSEYWHRLAKVKKFNQQSHTHLKGIAMTPIKFGISFTTKFLNQGNALVNIYTDGTLQVSTGGTEMGQGLNTKIRQLVADEFAIGFDSVKVMTTSTEKSNNASPTAASAGLDLNGNAALNACKKLKQGLVEFASRHFASFEKGILASTEHIQFENGEMFDDRLPEQRVAFKDMVLLAYRDRVNLGARGFYRTPGVDFNRETGQGNPFFYYTAGCSVSEVLIDRFTGDLKVLRSDILMDIGDSINPGIDIGQLEGGFIQGMGWVTGEELRYQETGDLLSHSPTTYKIPNIQDMPEVFKVNTIKNPHHQINVRRSKAVGEPPLMLCMSVWAAAKNALSFLSKGRVPKLNLPATNEEILKRITHHTTGVIPTVRDQEIVVVPAFKGNGPIQPTESAVEPEEETV